MDSQWLKLRIGRDVILILIPLQTDFILHINIQHPVTHPAMDGSFPMLHFISDHHHHDHQAE